MFRNMMGLGFAAASMVTASAALGDTVTLKTTDNSLILNGELEDYDGTFYFLRTQVGLLRLSADSIICEGAGCPALEPSLNVTVAGSAELAQTLFPALLTAFGTSSDTEIDTSGSGFTVDLAGDETSEITLAPSDSTKGLNDLLQGASNLVLTTRSVSDAERAAFEQSGRGPLREDILAIEGLVIVTAPDNSLPSISISDTAKIFAGQYANWSELGGPDAAINVYARDESAALTEAFNDLVMLPNDAAISPSARIVDSSDDLDALVAADPNGIGFTRFASVSNARPLPVIGVCGLVVSPNEFNIRAEEYPLAHRHYAVTRADMNPDYLNAMLDFTATAPAQALVASQGMLDQSLTRGPVDQQGMRFASALKSETVVDALPLLQQMVGEMVVSDRLSATLRFQTGSSVLDDRARNDINRVASLLREETQNGARKVVRVMGFTDSLGNPELNRELSLRRARQVTDALSEATADLTDQVEFRPMGFGDVSPIGCDQTKKGRWTNRRVELWISNAAP